MEKQSWAVPPNLTLREVEKEVIQATLQRTQWNIKKAAQLLGIDRSTLYDKIKRFNLAGDSGPRTSGIDE